MNCIFKNFTINKKLLLLYTLNISDVIFTIILINSKYFVEGNPLMASFFKVPIYAFLIKLIFPGLLLFFVYIVINHNPQKQFTFSNRLINLALIPYMLVNILHLAFLSYLLIL
ncbi:DUF5658 family protein [Clostridium sp. UBA5988]|uniref:DUF5658 family protein n=1 Tax=Clostridium sp. UBA5988 TaxID=1946369 RepID=UPI0039C86EA5